MLQAVLSPMHNAQCLKPLKKDTVGKSFFLGSAWRDKRSLAARAPSLSDVAHWAPSKPKRLPEPESVRCESSTATLSKRRICKGRQCLLSVMLPNACQRLLLRLIAFWK